MSTLKELRLQAHLTVSELARLAKVGRGTVERAESGESVLDVKAYMIVEALGKQLNREIKLDDVEGLNIL